MRIQQSMSKAAIAAMAGAAAFSVLSTAPASALPLKADRGKLKVVAEGVPQGRSAKITVAGKKYRKKLPRAGALRNLKPGTYRVWATPIVVDGGTAAVPNLPIRVRVPKRKATTLRVQYQWNPKTDVYPPGPVTGLTVSGRTTSSISLHWVNSQAPDLQGVAIRRKTGSAASTGLDDGRVVPVDGSAQSVVDGGLRQYTTYTYSVFMVDTAGNASPPASVTVHTTGRASQVTAGTDHTCALVPDDLRGTGHVLCWGANSRGQLGDGTTSDSDVPREVALDDVVEVSAGGDHTCALQSDGDVWCWGANDSGEVGDGSTDDAIRPVLVNLPASSSVVAGGEHTCAVADSGALRCWGAADSGQSGVRIGEPILSPRGTAILTNVTSVAAGWAHTCAVVVNTTLRCFGEDSDGQLGSGSTDTASPVTVNLGGRAVSQATAGVSHSCAVLTDGTLACWGGNDYGQIGDGTRNSHTTPANVLSGVDAVSAGAYHTCAQLDNGTMRCWGRNNSGRLGDGTEVDHSSPTRPAIASGVSSIATGGYHSCAVTGGDTYCWGANPFGQLGTGLTTGSLRPLIVADL
ncbi:MAG: hypothetical protein U0R28_00565 [Candidatus Nanopelagicales bacterium]